MGWRVGVLPSLPVTGSDFPDITPKEEEET
jgi:hypothetical protein